MLPVSLFPPSPTSKTHNPTISKLSLWRINQSINPCVLPFQPWLQVNFNSFFFFSLLLRQIWASIPTQTTNTKPEQQIHPPVSDVSLPQCQSTYSYMPSQVDLCVKLVKLGCRAMPVTLNNRGLNGEEFDGMRFLFISAHVLVVMWLKFYVSWISTYVYPSFTNSQHLGVQEMRILKWPSNCSLRIGIFCLLTQMICIAGHNITD